MDDFEKTYHRKCMTLFFVTSVVVLALSQLSSYLIEKSIEEGHSVHIFGNLYFTHIRNLGGIFGILQGYAWLFTIMSIIVLVGLSWFVIRMRGMLIYEYFCYGMIVGGGLGNITDRLVYGSVIDFIDVRGIPFWRYIFNTADVMIHLGIWPLLIFVIMETRRENAAKVSASAKG